MDEGVYAILQQCSVVLQLVELQMNIIQFENSSHFLNKLI